MSRSEDYEIEIARLAIELKKLPEFSSKPLSHLIGEAIKLLLQCRAQLPLYRMIDENFPTGEEGSLLAGLQNPQRRAAALSERLPYNEAIRKITGQKRLDRARKNFEDFLSVLPNFGDPSIPLVRIGKPKKGELPKFALKWSDGGIASASIPLLTEYYGKYRKDQRQEQYRLKGERTAARKKKSVS